MLIPSYIPRFSRYYRSHSWGIAYAQFKSEDACLRVINELNGTRFQDRRINVSAYTRYEGPRGIIPGKHHRSISGAPNDLVASVDNKATDHKESKLKIGRRGFRFSGESFKRRYYKKTETETSEHKPLLDTSNVTPQTQDSGSPVDYEPEHVADENESTATVRLQVEPEASSSLPVDLGTPNSALLPSFVPRKAIPTTAVDELPAVPVASNGFPLDSPAPAKYELSSNTIYIQNTNNRITDEDIRFVFREYNPSTVLIFKSTRHLKRKPYNGKGSFKLASRHCINVLVTVDVSLYPIHEIIDRMQHTKLRGFPMRMKIAHLLRVKAVEQASVEKGEDFTIESSTKSVDGGNDLVSDASTDSITSKHSNENEIENVQPHSGSTHGPLDGATSSVPGNKPTSMALPSDEQATSQAVNDRRPDVALVVDSGAEIVPGVKSAEAVEPATGESAAATNVEDLSVSKLDWASEAGNLETEEATKP